MAPRRASVVRKMVEAARNPRNHRYSASRGIPRLREEITRRYRTNYGVELDPGYRSYCHHRRQGRAGASAVRRGRAGRCGRFAEPAYPIHQYGVIMAEGHACCSPCRTRRSF